MSNITLKIPAADAREIADAFASDYGVEATAAGVKQRLMDHIGEVVDSYRRKQAVAGVDTRRVDIT